MTDTPTKAENPSAEVCARCMGTGVIIGQHGHTICPICQQNAYWCAPWPHYQHVISTVVRQPVPGTTSIVILAQRSKP